MNKRLIIHHGFPCMDGFCAAWVLHKFYPEAEYLGAHHGEAPPDVTGQNIIIADFSYDRPTLLAMAEKAQTIVVLDHHKDRQEELVELDFCVFNIEKSGAHLAWDYLHNSGFPRANGKEVPPPWIVQYIEDRDLWLWRLPHSKEINAALQSYPHKFAVWDELAERNLEEFILEGRATLRYQCQRVGEIIRQAREIEVAGYRVLCANTPILQSEVAAELAKGRPFGVCRHQLDDGRWKYSLRSTIKESGIDVAEIAHKYGGGGHPTASSFIVDGLPMDKV